MPFVSIKKLLNNYFSDQYGSFRGFLRTQKYKLLYHLGRYKKYQAVDWKEINRLVFVCKGNICRSAFAEAVAKSLAIEAVSFGIDTVDNGPADIEAIQSAERKGVNLDNHSTTSFNSYEYKPGDLFVAMEPSHLDFLEQNQPRNSPITLAGLWGKTIKPHIEDPYGKSPTYFASCFDYIENSVHALKEKL